jgi:hypothetical protein
MYTPVAALAWEFWRRHRTRLTAIIALVLGFALVYPKLCALSGFNLASADPLGEVAKNPALQNNSMVTVLRMVHILYLLGLACGPSVAMVLTLLVLIWMFTFTEFDQKIKDPMKFPAHLFTLPISTPFLFWWFLLAGQAAVMALYASWVYVVPQPYMEMFGRHQNFFGWMTLLAVMQAMVWALAAWPNTRMLLLIAALCGFFGDFRVYNIFAWPIVLPAAAVLAYAGLQKMRHGQWQGWYWQRPFEKLFALLEWRGPTRFASPAQAQLWFEWRRFAGGVCFMTAGLALVPVVIHVLVRITFGLGPLNEDTLAGFAICLVAVPVLIYFCFGASPNRRDHPFLMVRPLTSGEMLMPMLKTAAISVIFSWLAVLAAFAVMPLLGNFRAVEQGLPASLGGRVALVLGLIFLTWRMAVVNLCFSLSSSRRIQQMPVLPILVLGPCLPMFVALKQNDAYWGLFLRLVPILLVCLIALKFLLAFLSFGLSLKRGLLAPDAVLNYLTVWGVLVAVLLGTLALVHPPREVIIPFLMGVILLVPLARIGFCPLALARSRHT